MRLRPEDAALYPDFPAHVTLEDARLRFFSAISELSDERVAELTHLDYDRAMAFIAIGEETARCSASCACTSTPTARGANTP